MFRLHWPITLAFLVASGWALPWEASFTFRTPSVSGVAGFAGVEASLIPTSLLKTVETRVTLASGLWGEGPSMETHARQSREELAPEGSGTPVLAELYGGVTGLGAALVAVELAASSPGSGAPRANGSSESN